MAITGKVVRIQPADLGAGMPEVESFLEGSSETALRGAAAFVSAGYVEEVGANPANIRGFLVADAANRSADALGRISLYTARPGGRFVGTLSTTSFTDAMRGSVVNLAKVASVWVLVSTDSISSVAQGHIIEPLDPFGVGDTNPTVIFELDTDNLQYDAS